MKNNLFRFLAPVFLALVCPLWAHAGGYTVDIANKTHTPIDKIDKRGYVKQQTWKAEVTIRNLNFEPSPPLTMQYVIFVSRDESNTSGMVQAGKEEATKGTVEIEPIRPGGSVMSPTKEITLKNSKPEYSSGKKKKMLEPAKNDRLIGIIVRYYAGSTLVAEARYPVGLKKDWQ